MEPRRRKPRQLAMTTISADEFARYRSHIPAVTKARVMATCHASQHSGYELRDGKPVKQSVVARLQRRSALMTGETRDAAQRQNRLRRDGADRLEAAPAC